MTQEEFETILFVNSIPIDESDEEIFKCCINRIKRALVVLEALYEKQYGKEGGERK